MVEMPGLGGIRRRQLNIFFLLDTSGSMFGEKVASLNHAMRSGLSGIREAAEDNAETDILVHAIRFADRAEWHSRGEPATEVTWRDVQAMGVTAMGAALSLVAGEMTRTALKGKQLPPVLILVSDGQPSDDFAKGLAELGASQYGPKCVRVAIAIGGDADMAVLQRFLDAGADPNDRERRPVAPLLANDAAALVDLIVWASISAVSDATGRSSGNLERPPELSDGSWVG